MDFKRQKCRFISLILLAVGRVTLTIHITKLKEKHVAVKGCQVSDSGLNAHSPWIFFNDQKTKWQLGEKGIDAKLAKGFEHLDNCALDEAKKVFDEILKESPLTWAAYIGRAVAIGRKFHNKNASVEPAMRDIAEAYKIKPENSLVWQSKAELQWITNKLTEAASSANKAVHLESDGHSYVLAGMTAYNAEQNWQALQHLKNALKFQEGHRAVVHFTIGKLYLTFGILRESIESFQDCLEMQPDSTAVFKSLANAFKELGDDKNALLYLNQALAIEHRDTKALLMRGNINFSTGKVLDALEDYKACLQEDPMDQSCRYMKSLGYATIGQFYASVKSATKVIMSNLGSTFLPEYGQAFFLREFSRYMHSHLDIPLKDVKIDDDLTDKLKELWMKNLPLSLTNYTEQPGIQPHISAVEPVTFHDLSDDSKALLCKAEKIEQLLQYNTDGYMADWRANKAMSLAVLDVAQTAAKFWKSPKGMKGWKGRRFSWRDIFDVAAKWKRLVSLNYPVLWLDLLSKKTVEAGFTKHIIIKKSHVQMPRYYSYFNEALDVAKHTLRGLFSQKITAKVQEQLLKATTCKEVVNIVKKYRSDMQSSFTMAIQIPSTRKRSSQLDGIFLTLAGEGDDITFSIESVTTPVRVNQFHSELEHLWSQLKDDVCKRNHKDPTNATNSILSMVYYFYNLIPISKGSSAVAYTVAIGLFLAIGQEVTGPIPIAKQPDLEALFCGNPTNFIKRIEPWLGLKKSGAKPMSLPIVSETFPTARTAFEALNADVDAGYCRKRYS